MKATSSGQGACSSAFSGAATASVCGASISASRSAAGG